MIGFRIKYVRHKYRGKLNLRKEFAGFLFVHELRERGKRTFAQFANQVVVGIENAVVACSKDIIYVFRTECKGNNDGVSVFDLRSCLDTENRAKLNALQGIVGITDQIAKRSERFAFG